MTPYFVHGQLHTPYFIFIRCAGEYSDADLLRRFGLANYKRSKSVGQATRHALVADDERWVMIADDWYYTLWNMKSTRRVIAALADQHDVIACSVGDCVRSFDFLYYRDAKLVRKYVVFGERKVVENRGRPLCGEADALQSDDELKTIRQLAESLGVRTQYAQSEVRAYAPSESHRGN